MSIFDGRNALAPHKVTRKRSKEPTTRKLKSKKSKASYSDNIFERAEKLNTEDKFLLECKSNLLSYGAVFDGLISQDEAAGFIREVCTIMDHEDLGAFHCPTPTFWNLEPEVQLSFVWPICPNHDMGSLIGCLADFGISGEDFGYEMTSGTSQSALENVQAFCCSLLPFVKTAGIDPLVGKSKESILFWWEALRFLILLFKNFFSLDPSVCPPDLPDIQLDTPAPIPAPTPAPIVTNTPTEASPPIPLVITDRTQEDSSSISAGRSIGIALAGVGLALILGLFIGRRNRSPEDNETELKSEDNETEIS